LTAGIAGGHAIHGSPCQEKPFSIRLDDRPVEAIFALKTTAAESFETGKRVSIDFEERGILRFQADAQVDQKTCCG
jgi:hypothetical protein